MKLKKIPEKGNRTKHNFFKIFKGVKELTATL